MSRWLNILILFMGIVLLAYFLWLAFQIKQNLFSPLLDKNKPVIEWVVKPGTSIFSLADQLKQQNLLKNPQYFLWYAKFQKATNSIKTGEYLIVPGQTTAAKLLENIINGKVILRSLLIVEGWTFNNLLNAMNANPYLSHTLSNLSPEQLAQKLELPVANPEGFFYPDTYFFAKGTSDEKILRIAYQKMQKILDAQWATKASDLPYKNSYEALIAASLIERETAVDREKPMIAGVIVNRLKRNMRLQIDPTVIYALGANYTGKLSSKDLKINSPFNTYLYKGLPPAPIGYPSQTSIYAALHPARTTALYYVASGGGGHVFSDTLQGHDSAVDRYLINPKNCFSFELFLRNYSRS